MEDIKVTDVVNACGGTLLLGDPSTSLSRIILDSRKVEPGDLFVPIVGEKVDAHRFIPQVIQAGAGAVFTSRHSQADGEAVWKELFAKPLEAEKPVEKMSGLREDCPTAWIQVEDTRAALQAFGAYCRQRLDIPVIGITGSVGKTTTREMVAAALTAGFQVFKTPGNSNSQVGVPITMSEIRKTDEVAVIELGMSEPGELSRIARVARPSIAIVTNIGITHIEQLGSRENIYREKMTIQDGLVEEGILLLNGDDDMLRETTARNGHGYQTFYYGTGENCDYQAVDIGEENGCPVFTAVCGEIKVPVRLQVMGRHNVLNAMAAMAAAHLCGLSLWKAAKSLESFTGFAGRQQIYRNQNMTVIDDTYNASPVSMKAGLQVLCSLKEGSRKVAVLADMKELGEDTEKFHQEVGEFLARQPVDVLVTYGVLAKEIGRGAREAGTPEKPEIYSFLDKEEMTAFLDHFLKAGDCILFKGSNSMKLGETAARFGRKKG